MRRVWPLLLALGLVVAGVAAAFPQEESKKKDERKQEKKAEPKKASPKKGEAAPGEGVDTAVQERRALSRVLRNLADGVEGSSPRRVTEQLDQRFYDFPRFEDQVTEFLKRNSEIRLFLRESTAEVKGDKATLIVDAEMAFSTKTDPTRQQKRHERIQFDFVRTDKGWKIYEISPRRFFIP